MADSLKAITARLDAAQSRIARDKTQTRNLEGALLRKSMVTLSSSVYAAMNRYKVPVAVKGVPWKLPVFAIATGVEVMTKGMLQHAAAGISDNTLGIFLYDAISKGTLIAGADEADGGGEV